MPEKILCDAFHAIKYEKTAENYKISKIFSIIEMLDHIILRILKRLRENNAKVSKKK